MSRQIRRLRIEMGLENSYVIIVPFRQMPDLMGALAHVHLPSRLRALVFAVRTELQAVRDREFTKGKRWLKTLAGLMVRATKDLGRDSEERVSRQRSN